MTDKIEPYYKRTKCPNCEWSQFQSGEVVGMTPCLRCNSTGYIYERIEPQPDDSRLLTDEDELNEITAAIYNWRLNMDGIKGLLWQHQSQIIHAKDKECQERVEGIFEKIERYQQKTNGINLNFIFSKDEWQSLKKQEGV